MRSEQTQNATVTYGAALLLGINAIYQSDMIALQQAIEYLENKALAYPFLQHTAINTLMAETVRGYLLGLMMGAGSLSRVGTGRRRHAGRPHLHQLHGQDQPDHRSHLT